MPINIIQGDCLGYLKQLESESINCIVTDPPYGIAFKPNRSRWKEKENEGIVPNDDKIGKDWVNWFKPIEKELYRVLKPNSVAWFFSGYNAYWYYDILKEDFEIKADLVWIKNNFGLGYHFRRQYERIICCFKGNPPIPERAISDVVFEDKVNGSDLLHSSQKPEALIRLLIGQYTKENDFVLDPFMGSGTTAVACRQMNRNCIGYEINANYFEIAQKRLKETLNQNKL